MGQSLLLSDSFYRFDLCSWTQTKGRERKETLGESK